MQVGCLSLFGPWSTVYATTCSSAPALYRRWSLPLLAAGLVNHMLNQMGAESKSTSSVAELSQNTRRVQPSPRYQPVAPIAPKRLGAQFHYALISQARRPVSDLFRCVVGQARSRTRCSTQPHTSRGTPACEADSIRNPFVIPTHTQHRKINRFPHSA